MTESDKKIIDDFKVASNNFFNALCDACDKLSLSGNGLCAFELLASYSYLTRCESAWQENMIKRVDAMNHRLNHSMTSMRTLDAAESDGQPASTLPGDIPTTAGSEATMEAKPSDNTTNQ